ncbi:hypothetical protein SBA1_1030024 [Candidatus Sulfotelmatobacter kueseliae]|uniref:Uncharacterized protein n=1 Tax=Candidatus Sulfotelmatobacter kueseliae TaxID=2042962 RepID=A0A2U3JXS0_9BACT|nr:hypothetical protein SBA1_1030024 [Candidatus Sulfotelmatobacter kueseliae]
MGILENARQVASAVQEIHNLELYQRVLGLHSDIIELVEENNRLRQENEELRKQKETQGKLRLSTTGHVYYLFNEGGQQEDGPFCTVCWDIDRKLVRPFAYRNEDGSGGHICEFCRSHRSRQR